MKKALLTLGLTLIAHSASAAVMTYENRHTDSGVDQSNYLDSWNNQNSTIQSRDLDQFDGLRAYGNHQHSHLSFTFDVSDDRSGMDWWFQFAPDAGHGGEVYFDGNLVTRDSSNLWWGYNWNRTSEILSALTSDVAAGQHTVDVFWAENCCNGGQGARFSVDNGASWNALTTANLEAVGVPEPGTLALLGLGIVGLVLTRKKQKS